MDLRERFAELCEAESYRTVGLSAEEGIGIYNEKRLHRILKRTVCESESCFEVRVGRYVADVLDGAVIREIQCKAFTPLAAKVEYYLADTDYSVEIIHPIIAKKALIRAERETGEILRVKTSPKRESVYNALARMYPLREHIGNRRLCLRVMLIEAEEYRYSEQRRYCREGRYDAELFPTALLDSVELRTAEDYAALLPEALWGREFSAAEFAPYCRLGSRDVYSALNVLAAVGVLRREQRGRSVIYSTI